ncbi:MAG: hypothetical protein U1E65_33340 [Myxococcota bacterium]
MVRLARFCSIAGHPMILVPASITAARLKTGGLESSLQIMGFVVGSLLAVAIYVVRALKKQEVSDIDVSRREQRPKMFALAISCTALTVLGLWWLGQPAPVLVGSGVALLLLSVGAVVNHLGLKVSLHTAFAVYAAAIFLSASVLLGVVGGLIALAVGWSRVVLKRHTPREVAAGLLLGVVTCAPMLAVG